MEKTVYIHIHKNSSNSGQIFPSPTIEGVDSFAHTLSHSLVKIARMLAILGALFLLISFSPSIWYAVKARGTEAVTKALAKSVTEEDYQPRVDPSLPLENRLKITSIGVDAQIQEATSDNYEEALKNGVWRVSDFGTPYVRNKPTIIVAHRFGYLKWSNLFRRKNSFYNLPELKEGEVVEIIWRQRKYVYAIYGESEGAEIEDYSADLILYTCESLNSPVRIFKYARLLKI